MEKPFFVMLCEHRRGAGAQPVVDDSGDVMFWATRGEAEAAMEGHAYAEAFGFEIHEMGNPPLG